jgi:hypothetical protein
MSHRRCDDDRFYVPIGYPTAGFDVLTAVCLFFFLAGLALGTVGLFVR